MWVLTHPKYGVYRPLIRIISGRERSVAQRSTDVLIVGAGLGGVAAALAAAQGTWPADIVGTWSTKSNKTLTGPV